MIELDAATLLVGWAAGGWLLLWVTTRRREVGLGYGWLMRGIFLALAAGSLVAAFATEPTWSRDAVTLVFIVAGLVASAVSVARHALCTNEFKIRLRLQQQDPAVRVGSHTNLRRFLQESTTSCHTGIPWRDLSCCFGHGHSIIRRY